MLLIDNSLVEEIQDSAASNISGGVANADFNGDGFTDFFVVRRNLFGNNLTWFVDFGNTHDGAVDIGQSYGALADKPFIGDFDGNGSTDFGIIRIVNNQIQWEADTNLDGTSDIGPIPFGAASDLTPSL